VGSGFWTAASLCSWTSFFEQRAHRSPELLAKFGGQVLKTAGRFGSVGTELPKCLLRNKQYEKLDIASRCSAATGFFVVGPSGYIRVCNHSQINLCHYHDIEKLKTDEYWGKFTQKKYLPQKCFSCTQLGRCDGGCREEAHIVGGNIDSVHELVFS